jgi:uncharacterized membrane protein YfcA
VNAVAGGGSLITFPLLVFLGRDPILANATNTVSLSPGSLAALWGSSGELAGLRAWAVRGSVPSILGGLAGAWLLLRTPASVFDWLVPWLIAFATALFALSGAITRAVRRHAGEHGGVPVRPRWAPSLLFQLAVSIYGGYFGAGMGIMMLAGLALMGFTSIHRMIALRNLWAIWINAVAAVYFVVRGTVSWPDAVVLTAGQVVGASLGAAGVRRLRPGTVRAIVIAVGVAMTAAFLLRR